MKHIQVQTDIYVCFIEYVNAFDWVKHDTIIKCLDNICLDEKDISIIAIQTYEPKMMYLPLSQFKGELSETMSQKSQKACHSNEWMFTSIYNMLLKFCFLFYDSGSDFFLLEMFRFAFFWLLMFLVLLYNVLMTCL